MCVLNPRWHPYDDGDDSIYKHERRLLKPITDQHNIIGESGKVGLPRDTLNLAAFFTQGRLPAQILKLVFSGKILGNCVCILMSLLYSEHDGEINVTIPLGGPARMSLH